MFVSVVNIKFYVFSKMISILFIFGHSYWFKNNIIMVLWGLNYIFRMIKIDKTKNSLYRLSVSVSADMEINYRYRLSVSADMKIEFIGDYRYRPIWKKAYRSYPMKKYLVIWDNSWFIWDVICLNEKWHLQHFWFLQLQMNVPL